MTATIYSIGHSNLSWEDFRHLIEQPDIGCIVDVRSSPFSRWRHFRQHELRVRLNQIGISYVHLGTSIYRLWGDVRQAGNQFPTFRRLTAADIRLFLPNNSAVRGWFRRARRYAGTPRRSCQTRRCML